MGQRSATESVASILLAFVEQPTWRQAELAERVGISVPALRKRLRELQDAGSLRVRARDYSFSAGQGVGVGQRAEVQQGKGFA